MDKHKKNQHGPDPFKLIERMKGVEGDKKLPPVHMWNPKFCGDIDMRIARDGKWYYQGTPIERLPMVKLFSTVLRHDDDGKYYLVTPVEKVGIHVDDAPFVATQVEAVVEDGEPCLLFTTNVGDYVVADEEHPITVKYAEVDGEPSPYVHVRANLDALIARSVFYELVELAEMLEKGGKTNLVVRSAGQRFSLGEIK